MNNDAEDDLVWFLRERFLGKHTFLQDYFLRLLIYYLLILRHYIEQVKYCIFSRANRPVMNIRLSQHARSQLQLKISGVRLVSQIQYSTSDRLHAVGDVSTSTLLIRIKRGATDKALKISIVQTIRYCFDSFLSTQHRRIIQSAHLQ